MKKVSVFVPTSHADAVRAAIAEAGGGTLGNYRGCSFSTRGIGRFTPGENAHPAVGTPGKPESVEEEKIEFACEEFVIDAVIAAIKRAHPYEEPAIDTWSVEIL